ncbi:MAG TPA: cell division protein FtsA [Spirochaetia bacterium]|nr:cell division protein FtsA [Spirochaetia bacterium]
MTQDDLVVGLDIGTTKICAIIGQFDAKGTLEIVGVGTTRSRGLRRGVVVNIEATVKSIISAIEAAELMSGREIQGVFAGIAGSHIEGINSRGVVAVTGRDREITSEDVDRVIDAGRAIAFPMDREVLHVIPQEFIVDDQRSIRNPIGMIGVRLEAEVHIITGSVTSAQNIVKCVNRAGFRVIDMMLEPLASSRAVLTTDEKELGTLLVDMGGGTTDVLVYVEGSPYYTEVLPIGGDQVTNDLSIVLKTSMESAEKIKIESGCCYMDLLHGEEEVSIPGVGGRPPSIRLRREIVKIIQPRMTEVFSMVKEQVEKRGYLKLLGGGVVLTGGACQVPGTVELAQDVFGLPARIGYPVKLGGLVEEYYSPIFATGIGLVLYGSSKGGEAVGLEKTRKSASVGISGVMDRMKNWFKEFF